MIIVTGGAGFIGSNVVATLEARGADAIVVCDWLGTEGKWRNIAKHPLADIVLPEALPAFIEANASRITAIYHLGAISETTASDGDLIVQRNFKTSMDLWQACARHGIAFIYASSAATYGDGALGFEDSNDLEQISQLRPLNLYGWSKWLFDCWVLRHGIQAAPPVWAGLRFFNVYGPNEYHKGAMQSLVSKIVAAHLPGHAVKLFRSYKEGFADGEQLRDFIHVDDVVDVMLWLGALGRPGGIVNVGTGVARSFADLAKAAVRACNDTPRLEFVEMPDSIRPAYQYYTCADMRRLQALGYNQGFTSLEDGVTGYVQDYLLAADKYR
jgi:ADP-L-glycero-D-manno-heptose 6-epimerase